MYLLATGFWFFAKVVCALNCYLSIPPPSNFLLKLTTKVKMYHFILINAFIKSNQNLCSVHEIFKNYHFTTVLYCFKLPYGSAKRSCSKNTFSVHITDKYYHAPANKIIWFICYDKRDICYKLPWNKYLHLQLLP